MEESQSLILRHDQKSYSLKDLVNQPPKLTEIEKKIVEARLTGLAFCQLHDNDLRVATDKIFILGAAITGAPMPATEGFAQVLADEMVVLIDDFGFSNLTLAEIILAMRFNAIDIKLPPGIDIDKAVFSGNSFNIAFLSKILHNYNILRHNIDRKFQNKIDGHE